MVQFTGTLVATASLEEELMGDYNSDGTVDAADYVVWRKTNGTQPGYELWRTQFGQTAGSGAGATAAANLSTVPEPAGMALTLMGILAAVPWAVRRRSVV